MWYTVLSHRYSDGSSLSINIFLFLLFKHPSKRLRHLVCFPFASVFLKCLSSICLHWNEKNENKNTNIYLKFGNVLIIILMLPLTVMMVSMCMTMANITLVIICFCVRSLLFYEWNSPYRTKSKSFFSLSLAFKFIGVSFCMNEWTIFRW